MVPSKAIIKGYTRRKDEFNRRQLEMEKELSAMQKKFIAFLISTGAIKFGSFRLKLHQKHPDAPLSPIYIDLRMLQRNAQAFATAVSLYYDLAQHLPYSLLAGIPIAASGFFGALAYKTGMPTVTPRPETKDHGAGGTIDGMLESDNGMIVLVGDDLITSADSKIEVINILRDAGYIVNDVIVLIDREQGGKEQLEAIGVTLHAVLTLNQILSYLVLIDLITENRRVEIFEVLDQITNWVKTHPTPTPKETFPPQNEETDVPG